jgi:DNA-binding response OmpR family regulator
MAQTGSVLILAELDDPERIALEGASSDAGFAASVEPSAEVAIGKLGAKRFDALVVHMSTPGAALACMRARGKLLRVRMPVIALADEEDDVHFARAYRASADEVLVLGRPADLKGRLVSMPKPTIPQPGNARGDAVVADADRTRAEVIERVLRDAGFRVEMAMDAFAARLQAGRPSLKVAVIDASLDDVPALIAQARSKASRCAWVVRARPEQLDELRQKLGGLDRVAVVSAYGPPEDVLFETNRMIEPRSTDGRGDARHLFGTIVRLHFGGSEHFEIGYTYNVSPLGLFVRTLLLPPAETLELSIVPPGTTRRIRLEGRVVWRREFGATRREPVPAGFGIQLTGGETHEWAEACRTASFVPLSHGSERPRAPSSRNDAATVRRVLNPTPLMRPDVVSESKEPPRAEQPSVEQMLAQVLQQTLGDEGPGSLPLSIPGAEKDGITADEFAKAAPGGASDPPPSSVPTKVMESPFEMPPPSSARTKVMDIGFGVSPPSSKETHPLDITPESLGFADHDESPQRASLTTSETSGEALPLAVVKDTDIGASEAKTIAPPRETADELVASIATNTDGVAGNSDPWALVSSPNTDYDAALAAVNTDSDVAPVPGPTALYSSGTLKSFPPSQDLPRFVAPLVPNDAPVPVTDAVAPPRKSRTALWGLAAVVVGGIAAVVFVPKQRAAETTPAPSTPVAAATAKTEPAAEPSPSAAVAPSVAASAAPEAPGIASASASVVKPEPTAPVSEGEPDAAALATLQRGQGFLWVDSPLTTNVYVYGNLAGTTRQRITTKCGPRFLRLGTAPGAWQSEGVVAVVKCGGFSRVELAP